MNSFSVEELIAWKAPQISTLIGGQDSALLIPQGKMVVYGRWGSFKSMLMMDLGFKAGLGRRWLGFPTTPFSVMYLQIEVTQSMMQKRVIKYMTGNSITTPPSQFRIITSPFYKFDHDIKGLLKLELAIHKPDLLIVDPIYKVITGDISSQLDTQRILDRCDELAAVYDMAVCLVGHIRKPRQDEEGNTINGSLDHELIGSSIYSDWADTLVSMQLVEEQSAHSLVDVTFEKTRHSEILIPSQTLTINRDALTFTSKIKGT